MSEANHTIEDKIADFDPTDPEALAQLDQELFGDGDGEADGKTADDDTGKPDQTAEDLEANAAGTEGKDKANPDEKADTAAGASPDAQHPAGVLLKDGKHVAPYRVLEEARERAARAESTVQALARQLEELKAGADPDKAAGGDNAPSITEDDLAELEDLSPEIAKVIKAQMARIEALTGEVVGLKQEQEIVHKTRQAEIQDELTAAIEANPDLKAWRDAAFREESPDPSRWQKVTQVDDMLMVDPEWQDKPLSERFAKAVEMVKTLYGETPTRNEPAADDKANEDLKKAADEKLKGKEPPVPTSLSEIPGGAAPAQSDIENLENVSTMALGNKMLSMTPDQIEAYLARFG